MEIIERVARIVNPEAWQKLDTGDSFERMNWHGRRELSKELAIKIIEAMRDPTDEMDDSCRELESGYGYGEHIHGSSYWNYMITAALKGGDAG